MTIERTLVVLKPDAVERKLEKDILSYFLNENSKLKLIALKKIRKASMTQLDAHLPCNEKWITAMGERALGRVLHPEKQFGTTNPFKIGEKIRQGCVDYYLSGPLCVLVLEGDAAIERVRNLLGSALPWQAEKGTIRGDLGDNRKPRKRGSITATRNLIHASDAPSEACREIDAWFDDEDKRRFGL